MNPIRKTRHLQAPPESTVPVFIGDLQVRHDAPGPAIRGVSQGIPNNLRTCVSRARSSLSPVRQGATKRQCVMLEGKVHVVGRMS